MHTVEFESEVCQGMTKVPEVYHDLESRHIRVIAIVDDGLPSQMTDSLDVFRGMLRMANDCPPVISDGVDIVNLPEEAMNDIL